jgi:bifunctional DNA-binding transcriptional regulator/antitoxin component of YhaV-PrlF toxin-antitoxin module
MWDNPTMSTSTVDAKRRVVLPAWKPGDIVDIQSQGEGRLLLVRLERPERAERMSKKACLEAMRRAPLRLTTKWEELRKLTREP